MIMVVASSLLGGCSSKDQASSKALTPEKRNAAIVAIAQQFATTQDVEAAKVALNELNLSNQAQAVLALAESNIAQGADEQTTLELIGLVKALGPVSRMASDYLTEHGQAPSADAVAVAPATSTLASTDTPIPPTNTLEPTVAPTETQTPEPAATETATALPVPRVVAKSQANLRQGPGTGYPVVGSMAGGAQADVFARNADGTWWQVALASGTEGWVNASLVTANGAVEGVAIAQNIPTLAPTNTRPPAPPTAPPAPAATATPKPTPKPAGPTFRSIGTRLWGVEENGGYFDGPSIHCGYKRDLWVYVVDAAGNRLDGVTIKSETDPYEEEVSGNKGSGSSQFVLGEAKTVYIIRDVSGQEVTSDRVFVSTIPRDIPDDQLIAAQYCTDAASCTLFKNAFSCSHHFSWDVIFQRSY